MIENSLLQAAAQTMREAEAIGSHGGKREQVDNVNLTKAATAPLTSPPG